MQLKLLYPIALIVAVLPILPAQAQTNDTGALPEDSASLQGVRKVSFTTMSGTKIPEQYWLDVGCVVVHDQGENCDCAYCACAHARSILEKVMSKRCRAKHDPKTCEFSYTFLRNLHNLGKPCCNSSPSCCRARISDVLRIIVNYGIPTANQYSNRHKCSDPVGSQDSVGAWRYQIDGFSRVAIGDNPVLADTAQLKGAIAKDNPVIATVVTAESFEKLQKGQTVWQIQNGETLGGCHAVVITGYKPGYFQVLNSYGTNWGADGFVLVPVSDFMRMLKVAFVMDWTCP